MAQFYLAAAVFFFVFLIRTFLWTFCSFVNVSYMVNVRYIIYFLFPSKVSYSWLGTADVKIGNLLYYLQYYALSQLRFCDTGVELGAKKQN